MKLFSFSHKKLQPVSIAIVILAVALVLSGCRKQDSNTGTVSGKSIDQLNVSPTFDWATARNVTVSISAKDNLDNPIEGVRFTLYTANPDSGGIYLVSGITGSDGMWNSIASLPTAMTRVTVFNNFLGLIRQKDLPIISNAVSGQFGGKPPQPAPTKSLNDGGEIKSPNAVKWVYMSTRDSQGVPGNLMPVNDPVDQVLMHDINTALPEYKNEVAAHPDWFASNVPNNIDILSVSDVYITYITEGAGWMDALGYFTFNTNQPPASAAAIDTIHFIFPNVSNSGSGGGLNPGNKIYLGKFPAGKSIGFASVPHGWNGTSVYVGPTSDIWYSIPSFNTTDPLMLKHLLLFKDPSRQQILFTLEDQGKYQGSDLDCNDNVFYLTITPSIQGINTTNMPLLATTVVDSDHDGVPDVSDDYPNDPTKAFNNFTPSKTGYSSLAFEDLWPGKGDYDFNDVVVSYRFNQITNAQNQVVEVDAKLIPEASGANYHNGFAFQLPYTPDKISNITGLSLHHGYITLSANNTESGQSKAVVVAFDDAFDHLPMSGSSLGTNTTLGAPYVTPDTLNLVISLSSTLSLSQAGTPPFNAFIIANGNRNREVHLPDQPPTDKVNGSDFGTADDNSIPAQSRYYKTSNNLPWALNISGKFSYPIERTAVNAAYLKFNDWAESAGVSYPDWYMNSSGYRQASLIYSH
ncbi:MAG: LruC domain-containing protein [Bacteroidetes bacterium]|nr:LruC domain-containing protein [Bacteroidota bacterium]